MGLPLGFCKVDPKFRTPEQVAYLGGDLGVGQGCSCCVESNLLSLQVLGGADLWAQHKTEEGVSLGFQSGKGPSVHFING